MSEVPTIAGTTSGHLEQGFGITDHQTLQAIFAALNSSVILSITDARGTIIYANDTFVEVSKYSRAELIGGNHRILKSGYHPNAFYQELWNTISSGKVWRGEIKNRAKDGTFYWVDSSLSPIFDECGEIQGYIGICFLITDKKDAHEQMLKLTKAIETSSEVILMTDKDGLITYVNNEFINLYGYSSDEIVGKVTPRILKSGRQGQEFYKALWNTLLNKQVVKREIVNKTKDGRLVTIRGSASPIVDDSGAIIGFMDVQRDVTQQKLTEEALKATNAELETFNKFAVGRELKMIELKKRIKELEEKEFRQH